MDAHRDDGNVDGIDCSVDATPISSPRVESPFSRLPNELICSILQFASGAEELDKKSDRLKVTVVTKQISVLKLVCSTFAAFGDDLLLKFKRVLSLASIRFKPTQRCLNMILAVSRNIKLRLLIQCLGVRLTPDWANVTSKLEGIGELPKALGFFTLLHSINYWEYPMEATLDTRLAEVTAVWFEWFMMAAAAVSASPTECRPLSIGLENVPIVFFCHLPMLSHEQKQYVSNITFISITIDQDQEHEHYIDGRALRAMLAAATSLAGLRLEYMPPAPDEFDDGVEQFFSDCIKGQHWKNLVDCALLFEVDDWILLPFLERHAESVVDIALFPRISRCVANTVAMLDQLKDFLYLQRASVLVTTDYKHCYEQDCDCITRLLPILGRQQNEVGDWDIGHYLLGGNCTYEITFETWRRNKMASPSGVSDE